MKVVLPTMRSGSGRTNDTGTAKQTSLLHGSAPVGTNSRPGNERRCASSPPRHSIAPPVRSSQSGTTTLILKLLMAILLTVTVVKCAGLRVEP